MALQQNVTTARVRRKPKYYPVFSLPTFHGLIDDLIIYILASSTYIYIYSVMSHVYTLYTCELEKRRSIGFLLKAFQKSILK